MFFTTQEAHSLSPDMKMILLEKSLFILYDHNRIDLNMLAMQ